MRFSPLCPSSRTAGVTYWKVPSLTPTRCGLMRRLATVFTNRALRENPGRFKVRRIPREEELPFPRGEAPSRCGRIDYRAAREFRGAYEANPMNEGGG